MWTSGNTRSTLAAVFEALRLQSPDLRLIKTEPNGSSGVVYFVNDAGRTARIRILRDALERYSRDETSRRMFVLRLAEIADAAVRSGQAETEVSSGDFPDRPTAEIGVLFVHGIGEQEKAGTLVGFGEALAEWLAAWFGIETGGKAQRAIVRNATLASDDVPAYAELAVEARGRNSRWLLAESWWSKSFQPPKYVDLLKWVIRAFPWTLATHLIRRIELSRGWPRKTASVLGLIAGTALTPFVVGLLVLSLVVGILPIPQLRSAIVRTQRFLLGSIGDSYVLNESSIRGTAMSTTVLNDLKWLQDRCERVVILAHSQGAAVAHAAIKSIGRNLVGDVRPPALFITFGAGIRKLVLLDSLRAGQAVASWVFSAGVFLTGISVWVVVSREWTGRVATWQEGIMALPFDPSNMYGIDLTDVFGLDLTSLPAAFVIVIAVSFLYGYVLTDGDRRFRIGAVLVDMLLGLTVMWSIRVGFVPFAVLGAGLVLAVAGGAYIVVKMPDIEKRLALGQDVRWMDFFASSDPVPNGPIVRHPEALGIESIPIRNFASLLTDHNSYWQNRDQFVGNVAVAIGATASESFGNASRHDDVIRRRGAVRRNWRVFWLSVSRWIAGLAVLAGAYLCRDDLWTNAARTVPRAILAVTSEITATLGNIPLLRLLIPALSDVALARISWFGTLLFTLILMLFAVRFVWNWWDQYDFGALVRREGFRLLPPPFLALVALLVATVAAALAIAFRETLSFLLARDAETGLLIRAGFSSLYGPHPIGLVTVVMLSVVTAALAAFAATGLYGVLRSRGYLANIVELPPSPGLTGILVLIPVLFVLASVLLYAFFGVGTVDVVIFRGTGISLGEYVSDMWTMAWIFWVVLFLVVAAGTTLIVVYEPVKAYCYRPSTVRRLCSWIRYASAVGPLQEFADATSAGVDSRNE